MAAWRWRSHSHREQPVISGLGKEEGANQGTDQGQQLNQQNPVVVDCSPSDSRPRPDQRLSEVADLAWPLGAEAAGLRLGMLLAWSASQPNCFAFWSATRLLNRGSYGPICLAACPTTEAE
jgi:hypothetical protein